MRREEPWVGEERGGLVMVTCIRQGGGREEGEELQGREGVIVQTASCTYSLHIYMKNYIAQLYITISLTSFTSQ